VRAAGVAALLGVAYLLRPEVRAHRRAFTWLATGTVLCAALVAYVLTPYGMRLQTWLLD
jgi:hypothetical protein